MLRLTPLALLLSVLALAACGSDDEDATPASTTTATSTEPAEQLRVGLVVDKGQLDDNGFNELAFRGVQRAETELVTSPLSGKCAIRSKGIDQSG